MENNEQRPNAALINREWYEAAAQVLSQEEMGELLRAAVEWVLYGDFEFVGSKSVNIVFKMVRPALDSDVVKYRERCARNAANAKSRFERVGASGSQSQRVGANTTTTSTTTSTTTQSLSTSGDEEREKWLIYGYFWSIGSRAIVEECKAFWSYYESLGWKNNKGAQIVSKIAAARMWRRQYETGQAPNGADVWFKAMQTYKVEDYSIWNCYAGAERLEDGIVVRLRCLPAYLDMIRVNFPSIERSLQGLWRATSVTIEVAQ